MPNLIKPMICLATASTVVLLQASIDCSKSGNNCTGNYAWAVSCGTVSLLISLIMVSWLGSGRYAYLATTELLKGITAFLAVWWIFGVGALTFDHPYRETSNAYFAVWIALASSIYMVSNVFFDTDMGNAVGGFYGDIVAAAPVAAQDDGNAYHAFQAEGDAPAAAV